MRFVRNGRCGLATGEAKTTFVVDDSVDRWGAYNVVLDLVRMDPLIAVFHMPKLRGNLATGEKHRWRDRHTNSAQPLYLRGSIVVGDKLLFYTRPVELRNPFVSEYTPLPPT